MAEQRYVAALDFQYGHHALSRGQVIALIGSRNDEKLIRLEYLKPLGRGVTTSTCGSCGQEFLSPGELRRHGDRYHAPLTPEQADALDEREQIFLEQTKPIATERSAAVA